MIVDYKNVDIFYGKNKIIENLNFELSEGEFVFLLGKVGSGKTSFLKTLYAELPVKQGLSTVLEYDLRKIRKSQISELRRKIGIVFQDFKLLQDRNIYDNLKFVLDATGWKNETDIDNRIKQVLQDVDLQEKATSLPYQLSGGEQQRATIARAILNSPKLIIADEPTGNLDPEASKKIADLLYQFSLKGSSVIFSTHNHSLINSYKSRVFRLE